MTRRYTLRVPALIADESLSFQSVAEVLDIQRRALNTAAH